jgi:hypothetical protein
MQVGAFSYCPLCGSRALAMIDNDADYWETIAEAIELPIEVTRQLYDIWDRNKHQRFTDFVNEIKTEVKEQQSKVVSNV